MFLGSKEQSGGGVQAPICALYSAGSLRCVECVLLRDGALWQLMIIYREACVSNLRPLQHNFSCKYPHYFSFNRFVNRASVVIKMKKKSLMFLLNDVSL